MQDIIQDLITQSELNFIEAKKLREEGNHIDATKYEKKAKNYRTAAKLLTLIYPSKKSKTTDH
jgi:transposase